MSEDREVLWEKRYYLLSKPEALPKVLLAAHSWDYACLADLHSMLNHWSPIEPLDAIQLFLPWQVYLALNVFSTSTQLAI